MSRFRLYARPNRPPLAEVHRRLVETIVALSPPPDRPVAEPADESAAGLRQDAAYLAALQQALEPVIEAVVVRAVFGEGLRDVSQAKASPFEALHDGVLSEFENRAEEFDGEVRNVRHFRKTGLVR